MINCCYVSFPLSVVFSLADASSSETRFTSSIQLYLQKRRARKENGSQDMHDHKERSTTATESVGPVAET